MAPYWSLIAEALNNGSALELLKKLLKYTCSWNPSSETLDFFVGVECVFVNFFFIISDALYVMFQPNKLSHPVSCHFLQPAIFTSSLAVLNLGFLQIVLFHTSILLYMLVLISKVSSLPALPFYSDFQIGHTISYLPRFSSNDKSFLTCWNSYSIFCI